MSEKPRLELSDAEIEFWLENPVGFIEEILGVDLWDKQQEIAESVRDNKKTMVASCHGIGKTKVSACIAVWWLYTHAHSVVITTAPTLRQVVKQLWKEIRTVLKNANFEMGGKLLPKAPELQIDGEEWQLVGFTATDDSSFQGWHSEGGNLFIFDEATGMSPAIWEAVRGCLTSPNDRHLGIGNPTDPTSEFKNQCDSDASNFITVSAFDSPNVQAGYEVIHGLVSREWVHDMQVECGPSYESHPDYISRVLGRFPDASEQTLIPGSWYDAAVQRWNDRNEDSEGWLRAKLHMGVDVARYGDNKTVFAMGYEKRGVKEIMRRPAQSTMETAGDVLRIGREENAASWRIDADGIGAGVADRLTELDDLRTVEMRGGMKSEAVDKDGNPKFLNMRAEWYWTLRDRLDPQWAEAICLPPDKALRAQLTSIRWGNNSRGLLKIESKDEMAKRGIKSPDEADAVVYAMASSHHSVFDPLEHLEAMTKL